MLGLVRALLTNCKILMIYEVPQDAPASLRKKVKNLLTKFNIDKTIILFTHSNDYDSIADVSYTIDNGSVLENEVKKNEK